MKEIKTILITGCNGQLGKCIQDIVKEAENRKQNIETSLTGSPYQLTALNNLPNYNFLFTDIDELDITDINAVKTFVHQNNIDCIVNAAAYTNVDQAESEPDLAFEINADGVWNLAHICMEQHVFLIHISTDYVFDGKSTTPYKTNAAPHPVSVYGASKLKGEKAIFFEQIPAVIIRTSWLYSKYGHNFMNTMLRLGKEKEEVFVVDDQYGAPTHARNLAEVILQIVHQADKISKPCIYHYANEGVTTWYCFAQKILEFAQLPCKVHPVSTAGYPTAAKRPAYSVFDVSKIKKQFQIQIPHWIESLQREVWVQ
jgi:dTDP-4-dehydrorhamnose reductase